MPKVRPAKNTGLRDLLRKLPVSTFNRAHDYALSGRVGPIAEENGVYFAEVFGTAVYKTHLNANTGRGDCTCPAPAPCKHVGALAVMALRLQEDRGNQPEGAAAGIRKTQSCDLAVIVKDNRYVVFALYLEEGKLQRLHRGNSHYLKAHLLSAMQLLHLSRLGEVMLTLPDFLRRYFSELVEKPGVRFFFDASEKEIVYKGEIRLESNYVEYKNTEHELRFANLGYRPLWFVNEPYLIEPHSGKRIERIYAHSEGSFYIASDQKYFYLLRPESTRRVHEGLLDISDLDKRKNSPLYKTWQHALENAAVAGPKLVLSLKGIETKRGSLAIEGLLEFAYATTETFLQNKQDGGEIAAGEKPIYCISIESVTDTSSHTKGLYLHKTGVLIRRDRNAEYALLASARTLTFSKAGRVRIAKSHYMEFFHSQIPELKARDIIVRINENILGILARPAASIEIRGSSGIDWFEGKIEIEGLAKEHIGEAIQAIRRKDELIRLKNGQWLRVGGTSLAEVVRSLERLGIKTKADGTFEKMSFAQWASLEAEKNSLLRTEAGIKTAHDRIRRLFDTQPNKKKPTAAFKAKLRPYQVKGMNFILERHASGVGGILADDMGLGKTVQAIAAMHVLNGTKSADNPRFLVVCPVAALGVWESEIQKFSPQLNVYRWHGGERRMAAAKKASVVLTTFATYALDVEELTAIEWTLVFVDEAQFVKNFKSRAAQSLRSLRCDALICLTGTPLENYLEDLWALFDLIFPGYLGTAQSFKIGYGGHLDLKDGEGLQRKIRPFMLRRRKSDVLKELPEKTEIIVKIPMTAAQSKVYEAARQRALEFLRDQRSPLFDMFKQLTALRRIACHPFLEAENPNPLDSGKFEFLEAKLEELAVAATGVLIFSQYTSVLKVLMALMHKRGLNPLYLDGKTGEKTRRALVARFQEGGQKFFLISLKAGGTALTLTRADTVIHLDPWWNPAVENQATDRAHRIGQNRRVLVYKLVSEGTVEEKVLTLQSAKRELFDAVVDNASAKGRKISRADIESLLEAAT